MKKLDEIQTYVKNQISVEAVQWTGNNTDYINHWTDDHTRLFNGNGTLLVETLEGQMFASKNDFIIKGVNGEFYPCKPNIFKKTYTKKSDVDDKFKFRIITADADVAENMDEKYIRLFKKYDTEFKTICQDEVTSTAVYITLSSMDKFMKLIKDLKLSVVVGLDYYNEDKYPTITIYNNYLE